MGIYIKGIELPNENDILTIAIDKNGNVLSVFLDEERCELCLRRPKNKPVTAIHVPTHGRLIDAETLKTYVDDFYKTHISLEASALMAALDNIPTSIPEEDKNETQKTS